MSIKVFDGGIVVDGPEIVEVLRPLALRGALHLESIGLKRRGSSALSIVKREYGLTGRTAKDVLPKFEALLRAKGILSDRGRFLGPAA